MGATFSEAVLLIRALDRMVDETTGEERTEYLQVMEYIWKKMWVMYPYECEVAFYPKTGAGWPKNVDDAWLAGG